MTVGEHDLDLGRLLDLDIILLDLNLPDMSGYDVLRQLRLAMIRPSAMQDALHDARQAPPLA